jgi:hypothetical protein
LRISGQESARPGTAAIGRLEDSQPRIGGGFLVVFFTLAFFVFVYVFVVIIGGRRGESFSPLLLFLVLLVRRDRVQRGSGIFGISTDR